MCADKISTHFTVEDLKVLKKQLISLQLNNEINKLREHFSWERLQNETILLKFFLGYYLLRFPLLTHADPSFWTTLQNSIIKIEEMKLSKSFAKGNEEAQLDKFLRAVERKLVAIFDLALKLEATPLSNLTLIDYQQIGDINTNNDALLSSHLFHNFGAPVLMCHETYINKRTSTLFFQPEYRTSHRETSEKLLQKKQVQERSLRQENRSNSEL